jgi:hypothetical protein
MIQGCFMVIGLAVLVVAGLLVLNFVVWFAVTVTPWALVGVFLLACVVGDIIRPRRWWW